MIPYLSAFVLSSVFVGLAMARFNLNFYFRVIFGICGVLIVSVLAGIRDLTGPGAGTDVAVYGNPVFNGIAKSSTWGAAQQVGQGYGFEGEVGYVWLNFFVSRITPDPHVFYGVVSFIGAGLVVIVIGMFRDYGLPVLMWVTYLCVSYVDGFNLLRQGIAMSVVLLALALTLKGRYRWGILVGIAALLFHNSAFVFLPMYVAVWFIRTRRNRIGFAVVVVILLTATIVVGASTLLDLIGGVLSDTKYADYIGDAARRGTAVGIENLYRALPLILGWGIIWLHRKKLAAVFTNDDGVEKVAVDSAGSPMRRRNVIVLLTLLTVEIVLLPIREISYPFYRIPLYFGYVRVIAYAAIVAQFTKHRALVAIGAFAFVLFYFVAMVIARDGLIYSSEILDSWLYS